MMKWDDGKQPLLKNNIACFYRNNQCIKCSQPMGILWQFFYTPEGLLAEKKSQHMSNVLSDKYYYF